MSTFEFAGVVLPQFLRAVIVTIELTAVGIAGGFVLGLALGLTRVYAHRALSGIANVYIQLMRGTPLVVQVCVVYFGLPPYFSALGLKPMSRLAAGCLAMALNSAAYQAEYIRGAIQAISAGQMLAARSMGMSKAQAVRHVILPQALRIVLPSWSNEVIYTLLYSSTVYFIGLTDLSFASMNAASKYARPVEAYAIAGVMYLVMVVFLSRILAFAETRLRIPGLGRDAEAR